MPRLIRPSLLLGAALAVAIPFALTAPLAAQSPAPAASQRPAPPTRQVPAPLPSQNSTHGDWNTTFAVTPEGGHLVGNPAAAKKLITFVSYTCIHCANFEKEADAPLRVGYIHSGAVSVEVRQVIRNPVDLAAALATECGPESKFAANHRAMMLAHDTWMAKGASATTAQTQRWSSGPVGGRMRAIARDLGFYPLMERRGYTAAQLDRCLSDEAAAQALAERTAADNAQYDIPGTPSFVLNGTLLDGVHSWDTLQPVLSQ